MRRLVFSLSADTADDALRAALPEGLRLGAAEAERLRRTWLDTFDWSLHDRGLAAFTVRTGRRWSLTVRAGDTVEGTALLETAPGLAIDLPPGPVRDLLAPAIGIRRLLPMVTVSARRVTAPLLDKLDKTIGRAVIEERTAFPSDSRKSRPMDRRVVLEALRGFDREVAAAAKALVKAAVIVPDSRRELDAALTAIDRSAGDYVSKPRFDLSPEDPGHTALADIFEHLLTTLRVNEEGLGARLDEEFLHDYRVAVRRTRSALSHFGQVLPPATLVWAKRFFADLGRRTGAARDLDVLLIELPSYAAELPADRRPGLEVLAGRFADDCSREYSRFARWLATKSYAKGVARWQREIERLRAGATTGNQEVDAARATPMGTLAAAAIRRTSKAVFKQAKKIRRTADDEPVHRLRIRCKKLRYVLEFSRSLTPGGETAKLIAALKKLQDVLGTFNDLVVHNPRLTETAAREPADAEVSLATGWLLAELDRRHRKVRGRVDKTVRRFQRDAPPLLEQVLTQLADSTGAGS